MEPTVADRIIELAMKWQDRQSWVKAYCVVAEWRQQDEKFLGLHKSFPVEAEDHAAQARNCQRFVFEQNLEFLELRDLVRTHAGRLLRLVPIFDFFSPPPLTPDEYVVSRWQQWMSELESEIRAVHPTEFTYSASGKAAADAIAKETATETANRLISASASVGIFGWPGSTDMPATVEADGDRKAAAEGGKESEKLKTEGAVSQGVFVYKGKRAENIQPTPWRLLEFMEAKNESDSEEAYQYAIDEHDKDSTPGAIKGMIFKANQALLEVQHPKQLSKPKGVRKIVWV